ncbi:MAG TPA: hypothetical protein VLS25_13415 [Dehalococcoidia bacterium]|nr:hypothetical protein [Dehalococcoidia bacterium]
MRKSIWAFLSGLLVLIVLAAVACGGGGDKGSGDAGLQKDAGNSSGSDGSQSSSNGGSSSGGGALSSLLVSNPAEALGKSASAFSDQVKSMKGNLGFLMSGAGANAVVNGDFSYRSPDAVYMTMNVAGTGGAAALGEIKFDILMLGDKLYMNTPFFGGWVVMSMSDIGVDAQQYEKLLQDHSPFDYSALIKDLQGVNLVGTEEIDGHTYAHLQLKTDFGKAMAALASSFDSTGFDASTLPTDALSGPLTLDLWVDPDTGLPHRIQAGGSLDIPDTGTGTGGGPMQFQMKFEFEEYNGSVDIPDAPKDAKSFVDLFGDGGIFGDSSSDQGGQ